jgi:hypothetical protein
VPEYRPPELAELWVSDPADRWRSLGFEIDDEGYMDLGAVRVWFDAPGTGITSWSIRYLPGAGPIDGLATPPTSLRHPPPFATHPNGATGLDHVVVVSGEFERTADALDAAGMPLTHTHDEVRARQGFARIGPAILELVHAPSMDGAAARFWGLAIVVISLDELSEQLAEHLGEIRPAVQQGRRIATLAESAGLSTAVAFMSPEPP